MSTNNPRLLEAGQAQSFILLTQLKQYGVALLSVIFALGLNLLFHSYLKPTPTPLFFAAVMVSVWYGGLGPGLLATVLSMLTINYFLIEPYYTFNIPNLGTLVQSGTFLMTALLINSLNEAQRSACQKAEASLRSLRESEARFGCLAESNIIGMLVAELDGEILKANHNFLQMVGYTEEDLRTGRLHWREMTPPESLAISEKAVQELFSTGACHPFEKEYIRKDGSRVPVLHGAVMSGKATVTGFVLDLSEQKQLEAIQQELLRRERSLHAEVQAANAQLENVLASINDQFLVLDPQWRYVYVSDRVVETVGKSREELLGQCIWELFPDIINSRFYTEVHRAVAEQQIIYFEYFYSSWQRWFENRVYPSATGVSVLATDITERKQAEEKLQRTNQTLETLLDVCPVAIAFFDPNGIVRLWNRAAESIFGWSAAEAIGQFMPTVPHRQQEFMVSLKTVLSGKSLDGLETQHQRKDGQMVDLEVWANLTHDAEGNPGCLGIAWDITQRKRTAEALRQSESRFQVLVSNMPGMVYRYAPSTNGRSAFTYVSFGARELVELEPETILQDANTFFSLIHPDDLLSFRDSVAIAIESLAVWQWEGRLITPSGHLKWVQGRSRPEDTESGKVWDGLFFDITERKQAEAALRHSEERYRAIFDQVLVGISKADLTGKFIRANDRFCEIVGRSQAELLTLKMQDITHPDDLPNNLVLLQRMLQAGTSFDIETRYIRPDGSVVWVRNYVSLLRDAKGQPLCGVAVTEDITQQMQAEIEREQLLVREKSAREEAETANRIKDEFLAVLSHELRSPLNPILGWSKLLQVKKLDEQKTQQALTIIERNAKLQTQLIEDLLDVSRILRGKLVLNITLVSLINTVEAALETVRLAIDAKGIQIQRVFNLEHDQVMGDSARLQQVVWNLLANAVKFTPPGGHVEVRLEQVAGERGGEWMSERVQITVTDTGKGISPDFLPHVFDYFRQEDGTTTRKFGGLGLGLAIVRHIAELHGGTVRVESPGENMGATFTVQLPLMPSSINLEPTAESTTSPNLNGLRVLAVDDNEDIRTLIEFILQQAGAEACVVASATEALAILDQFSPEVLISDVGMPEVDGYMLIEQVKSLASDGERIPAIALTAYAGEIDQQHALAAGFQMHLAKPIEPEQLIQAIVTLVGKNSALDR